MIEEIGTVVAVEGEYVWVETQVKTTCNSCKASESCPSTTIAKAFSPKPEHIHLQVPCKLVVGQQVKIGISENALLHASAMIYLLPLVFFMLSAAFIQFVWPSLHELLNLSVSSLVALASYWWVSAHAKSDANRRKFAPVFLGATQGHVMTGKHEIPVQKLD